jgi:carboxypeptidase D
VLTNCQYPNFAVNNTYGIQALDDQTVSYMKLASSMSNGCRDQIYRCRQAYSSDQARYNNHRQASILVKTNLFLALKRGLYAAGQRICVRSS